jgi:hypothetical protein
MTVAQIQGCTARAKAIKQGHKPFEGILASYEVHQNRHMKDRKKVHNWIICLLNAFWQYI